MLKRKIEEATDDLVKQTDALDRLQSQSKSKQSTFFRYVCVSMNCSSVFFFQVSTDPTSTTNRSNIYEINRLKKQLNDNEKDMADRDEHLHDVEKRLQSILDDKYDLSNAIDEIRALKVQLKLKDRKMEDLAQYASRNELTVHEVTDENEELRAKLGMDPRKPMSLEELRTAHRTRAEANQAMVQVLQKEVNASYCSYFELLPNRIELE
jgi:chromosome segregation ATPase